MATDKEIVQVIIEAKDQLSAEIKKAQASVQGFNTRVESGNKVIGSAVTKLAGLAAAYLGLRVLSNVAKGFVEVGAEVESAKIQLEVLYGSVEDAERVFSFLNATAAKVPQTLAEVVEGSLMIKRFGMDIETWLGPLTDVAAYMGETLPMAASAMGRAYSAGIGAADIFRERGISNVIQSFKGIDDITKTTLPEFRKMMYETFTQSSEIAGMTERLAKSYKGIISMLKDAWFQFQLGVMDAGMFDYLKDKLQGVLDKVKELKESGDFQVWAAQVSENLVKAAESAVKLYEVAKKVYLFMSDHKYAVEAAAALGAVALGIWKLTVLAKGAMTALTALGVAFVGLGGTVTAFGLTLQKLLLGIAGPAAAALIGLAALTDWYNREDARLKKEVKAKTELSNLVREADEFEKANKPIIEKFKKIQSGETDVSKISIGELQELYEVALKAQGLRDRREYLKKIYPAKQVGEKTVYENQIETDASGMIFSRKVPKTIIETIPGSEHVEKKLGKIAPGLELNKAFDLITDRMKALGKMPDFSKLPGGGAGAGAEKKSQERKDIEALLKSAERSDPEALIRKLHDLKAFARTPEETRAIEDEVRELRRKILKEKYAEQNEELKIQAETTKKEGEEAEKSAERQKAIMRLATQAYGDEWDMRRLEVQEWAEATKKEYAGNADALIDIDVIKADKLAAIETERYEKMKSEAVNYRDFSLAQMQRMLGDTATTQEEKFRIQKEVNERIQENEVESIDAFTAGWIEAMENFNNNTQIMIGAGRGAAEQLRATFSDTFFNAFKGDADSIRGVWSDLMNYLKKAFFRAMADMVTGSIIAKLFGTFKNISGGGGGEKGALIGDFFEGVSGMFAAKGGIFPGGLTRFAAFANGGIATGPMLGIVGEGRYNEAMVPLPDGRRIPVDLRGGGGQTTHMNVTIHATDAESFQELIARHGAGVIVEMINQAAPGAVAQNIEGGGHLRNYFAR